MKLDAATRLCPTHRFIIHPLGHTSAALLAPISAEALLLILDQLVCGAERVVGAFLQRRVRVSVGGAAEARIALIVKTAVGYSQVPQELYPPPISAVSHKSPT